MLSTLRIEGIEGVDKRLYIELAVTKILIVWRSLTNFSSAGGEERLSLQRSEESQETKLYLYAN